MTLLDWVAAILLVWVGIGLVFNWAVDRPSGWLK
jgi:hypothetical protein